MSSLDTCQYHLGQPYQEGLLRTLHTWRELGHLCDVTLKVGEVTLPAHRVVLAAASEYFRSMFSGRFDVGEGGMAVIDLSAVVEKVSDLELVLTAIYTGELTLGEHSICGVVLLSSYLMLDAVKESCQMYLTDYLSLSTCLNFYLLADMYHIPLVLELASAILQSRFHDYFMLREELLQVGVEELRTMLHRNLHLHCAPAQVLHFLRRWTEAHGEDGQGVQSGLGLLSEYCQSQGVESLQAMLSCLSGEERGGDSGSSGKEDFERVIRADLDSRSTAPDTDVEQTSPGPAVNTASCHSSRESQTWDSKEEEKPVNLEMGCHDQSAAEAAHVNVVRTPTEHSDVDPPGPDQEGDVPEEDAGKRATADLGSLPHCSGQPHRDSQDSQDACAAESTSRSKTCKRTLVQSGSGRDCGPGRGSAMDSCIGEVPRKQRRCGTVSGEEGGEAGVVEALVVVAPSNKVVQMLGNRRSHRTPLEIALYSPALRTWSRVGEVEFPGRLDEKIGWRSAHVRENLYFINAFQVNCWVLSLTTLAWRQFSLEAVFEAVEQLWTVSPLVVGDHLYVLASNKLARASGFVTEHKYFRLERDWTWTELAQVSHQHCHSPLSILNTADSRIFTVKADLPRSLGRNVLVLKEGHILDTATGSVRKFSSECYLSSPVRLLLVGGEMHLVDGESCVRRMTPDLLHWDFPQHAELAKVRWCRANSVPSSFPCQGHAAVSRGASCFELFGFHDDTSALLEITLDEEGACQTTTHVPPPFKFCTLVSVGQVSAKFWASLKPCPYLHV